MIKYMKSLVSSFGMLVVAFLLLVLTVFMYRYYTCKSCKYFGKTKSKLVEADSNTFLDH